MKKRIKGFVGLCLTVALVFGGVGKHAYAAFYVYVLDSYARYHGAECVLAIGVTSGSAHTASVGTSYGYCSVSASFSWYGANDHLLYSNGNGAGGMHGAGVTMVIKADTNSINYAIAKSNHIIRENVTGKSNNLSITEVWSR